MQCLGECKQRWRADHLREAQPEGELRCPTCGGELSEPRDFNLMFETTMGPVKEEGATIYLRPETAQGIFVNFKNVLQFSRKKPPFGIAQIGKSFRNEITPGNFIFRTREFEQMEMEFFVPPGEADRWFEHWCTERTNWYTELGLRPDHLRLRAHETDELSHYSSGTSDIEYLFPIGWSELEGIANRGDYDLTQHATFSGEKLEYFDQGSGERYVPHVVEPAAGADRALLAFMVDAYDEEEVGGETRTVLRLHPRLAPVKVAVLPLVRKDGQPEMARRDLPLAARAHVRRVRRGRLDRQALPPPRRDRHAVGRDGRPPDAGGPHGHPARPRLARAGAHRDRRARRRARAPFAGRLALAQARLNVEVAAASTRPMLDRATVASRGRTGVASSYGIEMRRVLMPWTTSVLVVANVTAGSDELLEALCARAELGPTRFTLLVPAPRGDRAGARSVLDAALERMNEAGLSAGGMIGDADPIAAVHEAWDPREYDEIVVSTLPTDASRWLALDLPHRIERMTGVRVTHVVSGTHVHVAGESPPAHDRPSVLSPLSVMTWGRRERGVGTGR